MTDNPRNPRQLPKAIDDVCTLFLCGDVMTGRGIDQILPHPSAPRIHEPVMTSALDYVELAELAHGTIPRAADYAYVWGDALSELDARRPAMRIVNLETSVTTSDAAEPKGINYRMRPENVPVLQVARIDCCVLANNHVGDWGAGGLVETVDVLRGAGIATVGAGRDLTAAAKPAVLPLPSGGRILVFALGVPDSGIPRRWAAGRHTPGVNLAIDLSTRTVADVKRLVTAARQPNDVVVLSMHWGGNWGHEIPAAHRRFAHAVIEQAGVDAVYGHSSHHPKAIEIHNRRPIFYGCGDFLDDYEGIGGNDAYRHDLVLMYFPTFEVATGDLLRLGMAPLQLRRFRLRRPLASDSEWLRTSLETRCRAFGHSILEEGGEWVLT